MKVLIITLLLILIGTSAFSYPITPQPLSTLIEKSEIIVVATIENPEQILKYYDEELKDTMIILGGEKIAKLHIKEILKGEPENQSYINVSYNSSTICPEPPHYPDKKTVIAFLYKNERGEYRTQGLSYGSRIMGNEEKLSVFRTKIREYIKILSIEDKGEKESAMLEWLVECAENKYTRWDGARKLAGVGLIHISEVPLRNKLSDEQRKRLSNTFFSADTVYSAELLLTGYIPEEEYPQLKESLIKNLPSANQYFVSFLMEEIVKKFPNDKLKEIHKQVKNLGYFDEHKLEKLRSLVQDFIVVAQEE